MQSDWPGDAELIILDEIHKLKEWKSFVKGGYDSEKLKTSYSYQFVKKNGIESR